MNIKKCGIVTYHRAHNYGALLQAYALKKALQKLNLDPVFIDYQPNEISRGYDLYPIFPKELSLSTVARYTKDLVHLILDYKRKKNRFIAFEEFIEQEINVHAPKGQFEYLFLGSDQIWNASYTNGVDKHYYGVFDNLIANKKVSYAASMGTARLSDKEEVDFLNNLKGLDGIGVREEGLADYIGSISSLNTEVNLDPTLLLSKSEWKELESKSTIQLDDEPYLLVYEVHEHKLTQQAKELISKKLNLKVVSLSSRTDCYTAKNHITSASPNDFIKLFSNASFIITTSFHGTVFSIINEVPFLTLKFNNDTDIRSGSLLRLVGLPERHIEDLSDIDDISLDFNKSNLLLEEYREKSIGFIKRFVRG
jgi:hypothetical protein